ncbi:nickel/cobalt transporter [Pseudorhodoplanes sinuspersici]|uniref:Nickel/cobalt efflux system n=1 Tax=Pseudorhodoplanes sinuspersici TaxID=1235591 RepID=A0A1W6ZRK4_9HYPH|nr:nickel transporter [Pseudorhodoplanes sinuspersici]RKE70905.1 ABC-type nickel/cobalt efflux system permease component RcnA [Pseudorhodoplanes sinuspersici]
MLTARRALAIALICFGAAVVVSVIAAWMSDPSFAQGNPFGAPRGAPPPDGLVGWIIAKQSEFYRGLSASIRAAKVDGSAVWGLFGLSFAYGVFHAAGPGHGKAVISSYVVANGETWRRGVALSFASALLQALVAVAIVGIAAVLLGATRRAMDGTVWWIEVVSYGLIAVLGVRLLWVKGRSFLNAIGKYRAAEAKPLTVAHHDEANHLHSHAHDHAHDDHVHGPACSHHSHAHHGHHHEHGPGCGHDHDDHASAWGHAHGPEPEELAGPGGWKRGLAAIVAVGLRPCSGAILVLVFALAQGLFWAGVGATFIMGLGTAITVAVIATVAVAARGVAKRFADARPGPGMLVLRGLEVAAAILVLFFGIALLMGYMASERMFAA